MRVMRRDGENGAQPRTEMHATQAAEAFYTQKRPGNSAAICLG